MGAKRFTEFVIFHHAENARGKNEEDVSKKYPTITKKGEEWARKQALLVLIPRIKDDPKNSVVIFCGASRLGRTQETLAVLADELHRQCAISEISGLVFISSLIVLEEFLASPDQKDDAQVGLSMLNGLKKLAARFEHVSKGNLFLVCVGHAREMEALIDLHVGDSAASFTFIM